ncbi:DNA/RNA non-specific endonuclease, partial [Corallococcus sp. CA053C]|uniref:DNA/RNA non-specific endonuclease n=1 Tax=Corallococcus sp. CA053C TaxID=2316732 RepID=UPI0034CF7846
MHGFSTGLPHSSAAPVSLPLRHLCSSPHPPQAFSSHHAETSVGQWGDAENPSNDYDGGHLIGSQLGGWGG